MINVIFSNLYMVLLFISWAFVRVKYVFLVNQGFNEVSGTLLTGLVN